jgi:hypothetical protein
MNEMNEKQLIAKIQELRQIKTRQEWVVLVKAQILGNNVAENKWEKDKARNVSILDIFRSLIFQRRLAYSLAIIVLVIIGMFGFAQYTVPGDLLFPVKKITEQSQTPLEIAISRSDDLVKVAKTNKLQNLPPAIREFQASISQAAKNLTEEVDKKDSRAIKEIAFQVKKLEDNKKQLETLGIDLSEAQETKELNDALAPLVEREIEDLEKATLTDDQQKTLDEIKDLYKQGNYSDALEKVLLINE